MPDRLVRWTRALIEARPVALPALLAVSLLAAARPGPDFERYLDWSNAALQGDIYQLSSPVLSPQQVPLNMWSHGTGVVLGLGRLLTGSVLDVRLGAAVVGWLAGLAFWAIVFSLLRQVAGGDLALTFFGLGVLFTGTHAGYYSHAFGSETFGGLLVALLALMIASPGRLGLRDALVAGAAAGLLFTIRIQHALYALPALAVLGLRAVSEWRGSGRGRTALWFGLLLTPALLGLLQVGLANRWMTGDPLHSAYSFQIGEFRSIDPLRPELAAVLVHPWHGLLSYHPLYLIGLAAVIGLAIRAATLRLRLAWLGIAVLVLLQLLLQASWFFWWLGTETFGMRGMAITAVPLVIALVRVIALDRTTHPRRWRAWILLTLGASLWSFLLLRQGPTNFHTYTELLAAQLEQLRAVLQPRALVLFAAAGLAALAALPRPGDSEPPARSDRWGRWAAWLMLLLSGQYLLDRLAAGRFERLAVFVLAGIVLALAWLAGSAAVRRRPAWSPSARRWPAAGGAGSLVGAVVLLSFAVATLLFGRLAVSTERRMAAGQSPMRSFACSSSIQWDEVRASYFEYLAVSGFAEKQAALRNLLLEADCPPFSIGLGRLPVDPGRGARSPVWSVE